ncbi:hypothetical protein LR48_Vigan09g091200 [Vigna angularis]|uniref:Uncharacterized protein n=1 Tax=Phaseolus angularis TaxID=3914 RepID=A0A0L9VB71_PHAAN|nr:hypothetical protein LR48_Vigan09g091200 [Vigna angularis]
MNMKLYEWSRSGYKELVLIYSKGSESSILGLRYNQNRVLLRLRNPFCDSGATRELLVEVTAKKGNSCEGFYFWAVKVITGRLDDTPNHNGFNGESELKQTFKNSFSLLQMKPLTNMFGDFLCFDDYVYMMHEMNFRTHIKIVTDILHNFETVCDNKYWSELCGKESCFYEVIRKVGNRSSEEKVNWEFSHWCSVSGETRIQYSVIIECDKTRGLKAKLKGPFKCLNLEKKVESEPALTLQKMKKEPEEADERKFVESKIEGKEYILLAGGSDQRATVVNNIVNSGSFTGDGNGSKYENCQIEMKSDFKSSSPKLALD